MLHGGGAGAGGAGDGHVTRNIRLCFLVTDAVGARALSPRMPPRVPPRHQRVKAGPGTRRVRLVRGEGRGVSD